MNRLYNIGFIFILIVIILTALFVSCSDSGVNPQDKEYTFPDSEISFEQHVRPMFEAKCTVENACHSPGNLENALLYDVLLNRGQLILHRMDYNGELLIDTVNDPANPEQSRLYIVITQGFPNPEDVMPPDRNLYSGEIKGIKQWIREGAPE